MVEEDAESFVYSDVLYERLAVSFFKEKNYAELSLSDQKSIQNSVKYAMVKACPEVGKRKTERRGGRRDRRPVYNARENVEQGSDSELDSEEDSRRKKTRESVMPAIIHPTTLPITDGMDETEKCKVYRSFHLKKAKEYEQILKELGAVKERKPKLKVPEIKWAFLKGEKKVDKTIYQRLGKSDIWVKKRKLQELQEKAKDMDEYARKLM
ncbi:hypothetical protein RvY_11272 [Ramazzottius varieornatus]|uniref:Uncharacterized protein n=1 Tax=Ramazzottius varieornatus TaxID=947166 RepID=A0A1D1VJX9_RAMVA|nr:hypothetical protein RvY_11272 [Ramazzottius varieornatus]